MLRQTNLITNPHPLDAASNGTLSCYNMVPTAFASFAEMTKYLETVKAMGFNTVWINPIQETGKAGSSRSDKLTFQKYQFSNSLYAMKYTDTIDPRISTVKRKGDDQFIFTEEQKKQLRSMSAEQLNHYFQIISHEELGYILKGKIDGIPLLRNACQENCTQFSAKLAQLKLNKKAMIQERDQKSIVMTCLNVGIFDLKHLNKKPQETLKQLEEILLNEVRLQVEHEKNQFDDQLKGLSNEEMMALHAKLLSEYNNILKQLEILNREEKQSKQKANNEKVLSELLEKKVSLVSQSDQFLLNLAQIKCRLGVDVEKNTANITNQKNKQIRDKFSKKFQQVKIEVNAILDKFKQVPESMVFQVIEKQTSTQGSVESESHHIKWNLIKLLFENHIDDVELAKNVADTSVVLLNNKKSLSDQEMQAFSAGIHDELSQLHADPASALIQRKNKIKTLDVSLSQLNTEIKKLDALITSTQKAHDDLLFEADAKVRELQKKHLAIANYFDDQAIILFTNKAKELGITPIFDLVLNHIANNSPLIYQYPKWFVVDPSFKDALAFNYIDTKGNETIVLNEAIEKVWKPFIDKYISHYGFEGVRIDCVRKLPLRLREELYGYIRELMAQHDKPYPPVIFEELLFSESKPISEVVQLVGDGGGTHNTGSVFYERRKWHGGLPEHVAVELGYKASIVSHGTVNFTGNHDHTPAANEVLIEMAKQRLDTANDALHILCQERIKKTLQKREKLKEKFTKPNILAIEEAKLDAKIELYRTVDRYPYIQDIKREIIANPQGETAKKFQEELRDKFTLNMFAGSAGFYLLCGDEAGNTVPTEIYLRDNGGEVYPQQVHQLFLSNDPVIQESLYEMALIDNPLMTDLYSHLGNDKVAKSRLLSPCVDYIKHQINAGDVAARATFKGILNAKGYTIDYSEDQFIPKPRNASNFWNAKEQGNINLISFIAEQNNILKHLPAPTKNTWAHSFKLNEHIVATVRLNEKGFNGPAHIILTNLSPDTPYTFDLKELKQIAVYFQYRCFTPKAYEDYFTTNASNPDFHQAWFMIMPPVEGVKPKVYYTSGIKVTSEVKREVEVVVAPPKTEKKYTSVFEKATKWNLRLNPDSFLFTRGAGLGLFNINGDKDKSHPASSSNPEPSSSGHEPEGKKPKP